MWGDVSSLPARLPGPGLLAPRPAHSAQDLRSLSDARTWARTWRAEAQAALHRGTLRAPTRTTLEEAAADGSPPRRPASSHPLGRPLLLGRAGGEGATGLRGAAGRPPTPCSGSGSRVYCHVCLPKRGQPTGRRAPATRRAPGCRWSPSFTVPAVRFHWRGDEPLPTHAHWAQRIAAKDNIPGRSAPALAASWAGRWRCRCARPAGADRGRPPRDGDEDV